MNSGPFEILLPARQVLNAESAFETIENQSAILGLNRKDQKRYVALGMELFQNILRHRDHRHISAFRTRRLKSGKLRIQTFNVAPVPVSERLEKKFHHLVETGDVRKQFQLKLERKAKETESAPGDLGLEICFRLSEKQELNILPYGKDLVVVHLVFTL